MANEWALTEVKANPALRMLIKRYAYPFRRGLWRLSAGSQQGRDLLTSFPAAAVAIVSRPRTEPTRVEALRRVAAGVPLVAVGRALDLPLWYRRLPPEAFATSPMAAPRSLGDDAAFGGQILNMLPTNTAAMANWLAAVVEARGLYGDGFALWIGMQAAMLTGVTARLPVDVLALYAWHSAHANTEAGRLIRTPWRTGISLGRAACEARLWLLALVQAGHAGRGGCAARNAWQMHGFDIVPLRSHAEIVEEARAMRNCLASYVGLVAWGRCQLFGIRIGDRRVATFEVRPATPAHAAILCQICGPCNAPAAAEAIQAAQAWLALESDALTAEFAADVGKEAQRSFERHVWEPFAAACAAGPGVPSVAALLRQADIFAVSAK